MGYAIGVPATRSEGVAELCLRVAHRFVGRSAAFFLLVFGIATMGHAQVTFNVTADGTSLSSGGTAYINDEMPDLVLSESGGCGVTYYTIELNWEWGDGSYTGGWLQDNFACGANESVDWSELQMESGASSAQFEGGWDSGLYYNYIYWFVLNPAIEVIGNDTFHLAILGMNPSASEVDDWVNSNVAHPLELRHILAEESDASQTGNYNQYVESGMSALSSTYGTQTVGAPVWGYPHGIGMGQLELGSRGWGDLDFWDWQFNALDAGGLWYTKYTGASSHWSTQWGLMHSWMSAHPSAYCYETKSGSDCPTISYIAANDAAATSNWWCSYTGTSSSDTYYLADAMHYYNGDYFEQWDSTNDTWSYNQAEAGSSAYYLDDTLPWDSLAYTNRVCNYIAP